MQNPSIHFPLLSGLSLVVLGLAIIFGASVGLYDVSVDVRADADTLLVGLHPTFLCWMDTRDLFRGMCYGNVMICDESLPAGPQERHKEVIVAHEAQHLKQWRALGPLVWLAQYFLPLEPEYVYWDDPEATVSTMWDPPSSLPPVWTFVTITAER